MDTNQLLLSLMQEIKELKQEVQDLKKELANMNPPVPVSDKWLPKKRVMEFFEYGSTQMTDFDDRPEIITSLIGRRKFFHKDSIETLLNNHIVRTGTNTDNYFPGFGNLAACK